MDFSDIIYNAPLIAAGLSWVIAQIIKLTTCLIVEKKFRADRIFGDGGMPSGHSATVTCLAILIGWTAGFASAPFAISMILAIIVMNDARGVRQETGKQANTIKELADAVNSLFVEKDKKIRTEKLKLLVGHTRLQVWMGALLGAAVAIFTILVIL